MACSAAAVMTEPRKALTTARLAEALETGVLGPVTDLRWRSLPAAPESVSLARRFAESALAEVAETDADHVDDVVLVVSELITNAVREVAKLDSARDGARPVQLGVAVHPRWTHLYAIDTAPALPKETHRGPLAGSGRGIPIIKNLAAMTWVEQAEQSKTIHAVVTRTNVELTPEDRRILNP
jgi:anti-sigma regulatory factor (Ser/Thr protein kinase)